MILPLDIFTLIIEELVATIPDLYYPLLDRHPRLDWTAKDVELLKVAKADALKALKATCLTCRALVPFCQREIFAAVRFESRPVADEKWRMVASLDRLLQQSPHLSDYVRIVYFAEDSRDHPKSNLISRVLLKLHNVRVFDLDQGCYSSGGNWKQFPDSIAVAIGTIIKLPSLRILRMSYIRDIPLDVVRSLPQSVLRLILSHCSWSTSSSTRPNITIEPNTVELSTQGVQQADLPIVQPSFGPKAIAVDISSDTDVKFALKLVQVAGDLRHLQWCIRPSWTFTGLSKVLSTGISQTLTTLSLSVGPQHPLIAGHPCFGLHLEIWLIPKENILQSLTCTFHYPLQVALTNLDQFHELDKAITPDRFPRLTQIHFHFIVSRCRGVQPDHQRWLWCYQENFPILSSKEDIDFRCSLEVWQSGK